MMHHSSMRHTLLGRLLLTGVAAAFGLIYVPSATGGLRLARSGDSVEPVSLYVDGSSFSESPIVSVTPGMGTDLGNHGPAVHEATFKHQPASGNHHISGQPTGKNSERRQALAALAAILIQIQSAGTGGR